MDAKKLQNPLLALRLSIFLVMLIWTLDKFLNPGHGVQVFEHFYFIGGLGESVIVAIGVVELGLIAAFVAGWKKTWTYGAVLLLHGVSTLSSWQVYLDPIGQPNILFWAAWPMLAACWALFALREYDTRWTL